MTQTDRQNDRQTFEFLGLLSEPKISRFTTAERYSVARSRILCPGTIVEIRKGKKSAFGDFERSQDVSRHRKTLVSLWNRVIKT